MDLLEDGAKKESKEDGPSAEAEGTYFLKGQDGSSHKMDCEYYKHLLKGQNSPQKIVQEFVEDLFEMNKSQIELQMCTRVKEVEDASKMTIEEKMKFFRVNTPLQSKKIQMKVEAMLKNMCDCQAPDNEAWQTEDADGEEFLEGLIESFYESVTVNDN